MKGPMRPPLDTEGHVRVLAPRMRPGGILGIAYVRRRFVFYRIFVLLYERGGREG